MNAILDRITGRLLAGAVALVLLASAYLVFSDGPATRTLTAHFDRTVAIYPGSEVRVMGVRIGKVTAVVPEGDSVRVDMTYDATYKLPAAAKAAIVTPTLVADRFVQVFPAYTGGQQMADGADIPLDHTQVPVELDRIYKSLGDLSRTLGPRNGKPGTGALNDVLSAGAKALGGKGKLGSQTIRDLADVMDTLGRNKGPLFDNVRQLASITDTLAANDDVVNGFIKDLTSTSSQLNGERDELRQVLAALADVLGTVRGFVKENRTTLTKDVTRLTTVVRSVEKEKDSLGLVVQKGALAMGNLALAFDPVTGTFGSRLQLTPAFERPDQLLCGVLKVNKVPQSVCDLLTSLLGPVIGGASGLSSAASSGGASLPSLPSTSGGSASTPAAPSLPDFSGLSSLPGLGSLAGGAGASGGGTGLTGLTNLLGGGR